MLSELIDRFHQWRSERQAERLRQDELADLAGLNGKVREREAMQRLAGTRSLKAQEVRMPIWKTAVATIVEMIAMVASLAIITITLPLWLPITTYARLTRRPPPYEIAASGVLVRERH